MTNKARVGGILTIVSGAFGVLGLFWAVLWIFLMRAMFSTPDFSYGVPFPAELITIMTILYATMGLFLALIGVLGVVGGVFALKKRRWGLALAGAIAGNLTFPLCGIPAIIFVSLAKPEFSAKKPRPRRR